MRFLHTADWQIGKAFRFADAAAAVLRDERLEAIGRLARLARAEGATAVLVAGDVYDAHKPAETTLRQPIERMRAAPDLAWHLIPGNHDAHTGDGPWARLLKSELPPNVHLHLTPQPVELAGGAWLLPGVLNRRHHADDPTAWMDAAATPEGATRIGLAHGSVTAFGSDPAATPNLIATDRATRAGLGFLALGDWHGARNIGARTWYAGTPEADDWADGRGGEALVVELAGPRAAPLVTRHRIGRFGWHRVEATVHGAADVAVLEDRLRGLAPDLGTVLVWLAVGGALSLAERAAFDRRIGEGVGSAVRVLRLDTSGLLPEPTPDDLAVIGGAGFVRAAADRLADRAADPADPERATAAAALQRLYVLHGRVAAR